jgi:peptidoglycan/LPS O-acetylase OafA/YrhL
VIMIVGGLMASAATFDAARAAIDPTISDEQVRSYLTIYRFSGLGTVLAAGALAFLAGRARRGDARFRLATLGLAFAMVVVVGLLVVGIGFVEPLVLVALLPILVGAALLGAPATRLWYESGGGQ